jgi:transcriptional regulator with XRE-family HTH domain
MLTRIREVRKAKGLTLDDVAARCQPPTTAQTIGRLETGTRTVSVGWLNRIAAALEVPSSDLVSLPLRTEVPVAAILGGNGPDAPTRPLTLLPPTPGAGQIGITVETSQGAYRSGDQLWADQLPPSDFARAINRDILCPRPAGRFGFGRLVAVEGNRVQIVPLTPGARQQVLSDLPRLAVVRQLVRAL